MKVKLSKNLTLLNQAGAGLLELLIAVGVFTVGIATLAHMFVFTHNSSIYSINESEALDLAREGLEAVRSIRNSDPENFFEDGYDGNYEIEIIANKWSLSELTGDPVKINDRYERVVEIINVGEGRREITTTVEWSEEKSVSLTELLTFWQKEIEAEPILSNPTSEATGEITATGEVDTDQSTGTLYWVVTTSSTSPSASQVKDGENDKGEDADAFGNQSVVTTGTQAVNASGLSSDTTYYFHFMHENEEELQSDVVTSNSFDT